MERRYYLSSLPVDVAQLAKAVRGHWAVENQLHWVLDVVFGENQSRARTGHAVANLGLLRRLALNLLRRDKTCKRGAKGKQLNAALKPDYLLRLLNYLLRQPCFSRQTRRKPDSRCRRARDIIAARAEIRQIPRHENHERIGSTARGPLAPIGGER